MHRQSLTAYGKPLERTRATTPEPVGSQVLVKVSHCGVCHSDLHLQDGFFELGGGKKLDIRKGRKLPFTLGHEIAGVVERAGPDAKAHVRIGSACAVYPWIGCGECATCTSGNGHLCKTTHHIGITADGGFASHVLVPHPRFVLDIDGIDPMVAGSLMCSGITAYGALKKALAFVRDEAVMIIGAGGVGMMALRIARALMSGPVACADIDPAKRAAALAAGATHVFDPGEEDVRKKVFSRCGPCGAAIDFAGTSDSINFALSVTGKAAGVVVVGLMGGSLNMPVALFALRPVSILGSFAASLGETRELLELVRAGKIDPIAMTTRPLDEANEALDDLRAARITGRVVLTV